MKNLPESASEDQIASAFVKQDQLAEFPRALATASFTFPICVVYLARAKEFCGPIGCRS
jgi:hypothetical protein